MQHFRNTGYGWTCRHCSDEQTERAAQDSPRARFFSEGEAEEREAKLASAALARWRDEARQMLFCPRCGVEERMQA